MVNQDRAVSTMTCDKNERIEFSKDRPVLSQDRETKSKQER